MRIAILTNFRRMQDWFSLVRVVSDQATMLVRNGHDVTICVDACCEDHFNGHYPLRIDPIIPSRPFKEDHPHSLDELTDEDRRYAEQLGGRLRQYLQDFDAVFTHDWILVGPSLPYAEALRHAAPFTRHLQFFHWLHSIPARPFDWWNIHRYGMNHHIVYPNKTDLDMVAQQFCAERYQAFAIPHIVDLRSLYDFHPQTWDIIDRCPGLMQADFVQIYPAAADRLSDKGLQQLIYVFMELKRSGRSVCLFVADSWTGRFPKERLFDYTKIGERNGLTSDELVFSSNFGEVFKNGVSRRVLRELMQCSNLFVFPSQAETFGLVLPEAVLAGGVFPVLNRSLSPMREVGGNYGLYYDFGSCEKQLNLPNPREHYERLTEAIISITGRDDCFQSRTFMRQSYNMDSIYRRHYAPMLTVSQADLCCNA